MNSVIIRNKEMINFFNLIDYLATESYSCGSVDAILRGTRIEDFLSENDYENLHILCRIRYKCIESTESLGLKETIHKALNTFITSYERRDGFRKMFDLVFNIPKFQRWIRIIEKRFKAQLKYRYGLNVMSGDNVFCIRYPDGNKSNIKNLQFDLFADWYLDYDEPFKNESKAFSIVAA